MSCLIKETCIDTTNNENATLLVIYILTHKVLSPFFFDIYAYSQIEPKWNHGFEAKYINNSSDKSFRLKIESNWVNSSNYAIHFNARGKSNCEYMKYFNKIKPCIDDYIEAPSSSIRDTSTKMIKTPPQKSFNKIKPSIEAPSSVQTSIRDTSTHPDVKDSKMIKTPPQESSRILLYPMYILIASSTVLVMVFLVVYKLKSTSGPPSAKSFPLQSTSCPSFTRQSLLKEEKAAKLEDFRCYFERQVHTTIEGDRKFIYYGFNRRTIFPSKWTVNEHGKPMMH